MKDKYISRAKHMNTGQLRFNPVNLQDAKNTIKLVDVHVDGEPEKDMSLQQSIMLR